MSEALKDHKRASEKGSALIYILIAIALLAVLTLTFMEPSSQQTSSQNTFKAITELQGQVDTIRAAVQECVLSYPKGDNTIVTTGGGATDPGARKNWPINPNSDHYATATPGQSGDRLVRNLRCPGNNPGGADVDDHEPIFAGSSGKFLPPAPDLFEDWEYYNGNDGVFFWTSTSKTDAFLSTALDKLDDNFSECEADVIDAVGGAEELDSDGDVECPAGSVCFRVRMINNASSVFNGDSGDEAGC
jgi:hypothetical protein